jgi:hypothetical protein
MCRSTSPMTAPEREGRTVETHPERIETERIVGDASRTLTTLRLRLYGAANRDDETEIKWLHKRILAIERAAQERTASDGE